MAPRRPHPIGPSRPLSICGGCSRAPEHDEHHDDEDPDLTLCIRLGDQNCIKPKAQDVCPFKGEPIRTGKLWHHAADCVIALLDVSLFVNGLLISKPAPAVARTDAPEDTPEGAPEQRVPDASKAGGGPCDVEVVGATKASWLQWSAFTVVQAIDATHGFINEAYSPFVTFELSLILHRVWYCFCTETTEERDQWVYDISIAMRAFTRSFFPAFQIEVHPVVGASNTRTRIMAGYLLYGWRDVTTSMVYCELHAHAGGTAELTMYQDDECSWIDVTEDLTKDTRVIDVAGENGSIFVIDSHLLSARSAAEKDVWLRAIRNIKMKLTSGAPDASYNDIVMFRNAIEERLHMLVSLNRYDSVNLAPTLRLPECGAGQEVPPHSGFHIDFEDPLLAPRPIAANRDWARSLLRESRGVQKASSTSPTHVEPETLLSLPAPSEVSMPIALEAMPEEGIAGDNGRPRSMLSVFCVNEGTDGIVLTCPGSSIDVVVRNSGEAKGCETGQTAP
mmetsp:Transcript_74516/g.207017  ORF Transcript_74516/g.207017 Transcript_74516/m.207017 type:complete len:505 (-) Transcript_74516:279-1793(-)